MGYFGPISAVELLRSVGIGILILYGVALWGALAYRIVIADSEDDDIFYLGASIAFGVVVLAASVLLFGHTGLLSAPTMVVFLAASTCVLPLVGRPLARSFATVLSGVLRAVRREPLFAIAGAGMLALILVASLRPPLASDEVGYHWSSALYWATHGGLVPTPYRYTDGPALMEIVYTVPALFNSPDAAHWLHITTLLVLIAGVTILARRLRLSALIAAALILSIPVIAQEAPLAYNDNAFVAFLIMAFVALTSTITGARRAVAAGILIAAAVSTKTLLGLLAIPPVLLGAWAWWWIARERRPRSSDVAPRRAVWVSGAFMMPLIVAGLAWALHTHAMTGQFLPASTSFYIQSFKDNPIAAGRIPSLTDLLTFPFIPFFAGVLGNREPYGGRIGLVLFVFLPILVVALPFLRAGQQRVVFTALVPGVLYFLTFDLVFARTRYNDYVWVMLSLAVLAVATFQLAGRYRQVWRLGLLGAVGLGMLDAAHVLVRHL